MPSASQKRFIANGRSADITSTTVFARPPAFSLNLRVDVWHTGVSRLGTMLSTLRLPAKSLRVTSFRSLPVNVKSGALSPAFGKLPATLTGLPPRVTLDIHFSLLNRTLENSMLVGRRRSGREDALQL